MLRVVVFGVLAGLGGIACAEEGLDLAVLLDRSRSMSGYSRHDTILLRLILDLMARNASAYRIEHRLSVIGFGSSPIVELPFTAISGAESQKALKQRIDLLRYEDRGGTDVFPALELAEELFRALPASASRRRAIVLVTDGVLQVRGANMTSYRAELLRFVTSQFTQPGVSVDILLFGSDGGAMWRDLGRVTAVADPPDQLLPQVHETVARLVGTATAESAAAKTNPAIDTLIVPPYLDSIVFDIFRASAGARVDVYPPGRSIPIRAGAGGIESIQLGDVLATLVVPRPAPGEWTIRKSRADARVRILSQQFFPRGELLRPAETELLRRCDRISLAYRLHDGNGQRFEELPRYALAMEMTLAKPGGGSETIPMDRDAGVAGVFRSSRHVLCDLAGRYWTHVRIRTVDANGRHLDVFRDRWSGFTVAPGDCKPRPEPLESVRKASRMPGLMLIVAALFAVIACVLWMRRKTRS